jgi:hypothetical protein
MKHMKIAGLSLVAIFALSMVTAVTASAKNPTLPAWEQCVQVLAGDGTYETGSCAKEGGAKEFIWTWDVGPHLRNSIWCQDVQEIGGRKEPGFFADENCTKKEGGPTSQFAEATWKPGFAWKKAPKGKLRSESGVVIACESNEGTGEFLSTAGGKEVRIKKITFTGCTSAGKECKTSGAAKETITTNELEGVLGYIKKATEVGMQLKPVGGTLFSEFECTIGGVKAKVKVTGCIIGSITPINTPGTETTLKFAEHEGSEKPEQKPNKFEGGETCELTAENNITKKAEKSSLVSEATVTSEGTMQIIA